MNISIHDITKVVRGKVEKNTTDRGETYYTMRINFITSELSDFKNRNSDEILFGNCEVKHEILLFAKTKEALKIKVENII